MFAGAFGRRDEGRRIAALGESEMTRGARETAKGRSEGATRETALKRMEKKEGDRERYRNARRQWWGVGDRRAVDAGATHDRTASRGDAQSRPSQSSADIRAITLSTVLKISVLVPAYVGTQ